MNVGLYYITDMRDGVVWTWNGSEFRPANKHEAKGYRYEKTAFNQMLRLYKNGFSVGIPGVRQAR